MPEQPKSGKLLIKQYQKYLDSKARFEIALKIVQVKVKHSLNVLKELSKFYESVDIVKIRKSTEKEDLLLLGNNDEQLESEHFKINQATDDI